MLYLVRHAQAEPAREGADDAARLLTREGREDTILAARGLRRLGVGCDVVLASPLKRARETAQLLSVALKAEVREHAALAPGHLPEDLVLSLVEYNTASAIVLVGHEPDMGRLASWLLVGDSAKLQMPFKSGQVAAIEVASIPPRAPGLLRWFATQQQLAFIGT
ncbi:hypothetical protein HRbin30_01001 [bacterium HR30]|nr:hypothetical protein HRbin30_01001 [bacterium HR30]